MFYNNNILYGNLFSNYNILTFLTKHTFRHLFWCFLIAKFSVFRIFRYQTQKWVSRRYPSLIYAHWHCTTSISGALICFSCGKFMCFLYVLFHSQIKLHEIFVTLINIYMDYLRSCSNFTKNWCFTVLFNVISIYKIIYHIMFLSGSTCVRCVGSVCFTFRSLTSVNISSHNCKYIVTQL